MKVRHAKICDAEAICEIVNYHAERGRMLHLSLESAYERLRNFVVAEDEGQIVGCVAVEIVWADLAEVRSLAVLTGQAGKGIGKQLVLAAADEARKLGIMRLFALTYEERFFAGCGFEVIDKDDLPSKIWSVCITCPKRTACDETAMQIQLTGLPPQANA